MSPFVSTMGQCHTSPPLLQLVHSSLSVASLCFLVSVTRLTAGTRFCSAVVWFAATASSAGDSARQKALVDARRSRSVPVTHITSLTAHVTVTSAKIRYICQRNKSLWKQNLNISNAYVQHKS